MKLLGQILKKVQIIKILVSLIDVSWYTSTDFRGGATEDLTHNKTLDPILFVCFGCKSRDFFWHTYITYNKMMSISENKSTSLTVLLFLICFSFFRLFFLVVFWRLGDVPIVMINTSGCDRLKLTVLIRVHLYLSNSSKMNNPSRK